MASSREIGGSSTLLKPASLTDSGLVNEANGQSNIRMKLPEDESPTALRVLMIVGLVKWVPADGRGHCEQCAESFLK